jgi:hypothetical protein
LPEWQRHTQGIHDSASGEHDPKGEDWPLHGILCASTVAGVWKTRKIGKGVTMG